MTLPCPECQGDERNVKPYRLGWRGMAFYEHYLCRVCAGRGVVCERIAALYAAGKLPMPMLYETWEKLKERRKAKVNGRD